MSQRTERVDELLRQEIGTLLAKEIADPRIGFATITGVETAPDLRHAKVWVSVIGGKGDRDETLRALAQAMPFIRHELGKRLRIRRIPELHVRLDDSAERGTRVLHLLQELEAGVEPEKVTPFDESLPTPVKRLPHEGDLIEAPDDDALVMPPVPAAPKGEAKARISAEGRRAQGLGARLAQAQARAADASRMTTSFDLAALAADAVPGLVLERIRAARHVLAVSHEHPDADTLGAVRGDLPAGGGPGGQSDTRVHAIPCPPLYDFMPGLDRFRTDPDPAESYDLLVLADCATAERVGDVAVRNAELFRALPRVIIDHHASSDARGEADWIDPAAAATCEMVALLAIRLGLPLDLGRRALADALMAGIVMDTATFAHPNATPRTLAVAAALVEAGAPLSDISRRLYRTKPDAQLRLFGRVLDRLETTADGLVIWSTLRDLDLEETGAIPAHSEGIIDLLAQSETAEVSMVLKEQDATSTRLSVRTKPGGVDATVLTGTFGGGGHARAAGATVPLPLDEAVDAALEVAERLASEVRR